jgi:pyruvate dehydrogenase E2 component (dihydrolipoamide acetyltransferase)
MGIFRMPSLGADMEAGTLVEWLRKPGDGVKPGDIVAVVETQKGAIEIEVFAAGVIGRLLVEPGATVPVGAPLAEISGIDDTPSESPVPRSTGVTPPIPAPSRPIARTMPGIVAASPAARSLAAEHGLDLASISGSGPDGAVLFMDVEAALKHAPPPPATPSPSPSPRPSTVIDRTAMRGAISAAMSRAKREIPHYYVAHSAEIGAALDWLTRTNANRPPAQRLLPAALFIKALAIVLRKLPEFNGFYRNGTFEASARIHVGVAIALRGGGLIAPAIHDTDLLSLDDVMSRLRDLVARVRAGRFRGSELSDPTITLTSLGDRGVDLVLPVIYPPQVAIVGLGTPRSLPWVIDGNVEARPVVAASLAGDHRVSDGHRGAMLLAAWAEQMQHPDTL